MNLPELTTYTTARGKVIAGFFCDFLTEDEARKIDKYTFKKDGGWFIRARHVDELKAGGYGHG